VIIAGLAIAHNSLDSIKLYVANHENVEIVGKFLFFTFHGCWSSSSLVSIGEPRVPKLLFLVVRDITPIFINLMMLDGGASARKVYISASVKDH
jgi:hypothetical protein